MLIEINYWKLQNIIFTKINTPKQILLMKELFLKILFFKIVKD